MENFDVNIDIIPPSEDEDLLDESSVGIEIVNENNEVLGHLLGSLPGLNDNHDKVENFEMEHTDSVTAHQNEDTDSDSNTIIMEPPEIPSSVDGDSDSNYSDYSDLPYEIEEPNPEPELTAVPIVNYARDEVHPDDSQLGWDRLEKDTGPSYGPFMGTSGLIMDNSDNVPEKYFEAFFEESMWTLLAEQTNHYARQRIKANRGKNIFSSITVRMKGMTNAVLHDTNKTYDMLLLLLSTYS